MLRGIRHQPEHDFRVDSSVISRIERLPKPANDLVLDEESPAAEQTTTRVTESLTAPESRLTESIGVGQGEAPGETYAGLEELRTTVLACTKCPHLVEFRHTVVFGVGNPKAELMFVGEAPGAEEDMQGEPFVGRAGELLTRIIQTMGYQRCDVYIANVLKCRPDMPPGASGNRQPTPTEMETCLPYLRQQIELIRPKVMVALGGTAMRGLFGVAEPMKQLRGRWHAFNSIPVMATFHPSYLLRNQALSEKRKVWEDMLQVLERLERPISEKQRNYFLAR
ncbi:MAG TPA: uracil-DNA glycosylase [Chthoniobacterales bacterium]|jgi:DNA polymerase|nr:uracil-DNA glycosylase [Chthoniobacterales bacterium]